MGGSKKRKQPTKQKDKPEEKPALPVLYSSGNLPAYDRLTKLDDLSNSDLRAMASDEDGLHPNVRVLAIKEVGARLTRDPADLELKETLASVATTGDNTVNVPPEGITVKTNSEDIELTLRSFANIWVKREAIVSLVPAIESIEDGELLEQMFFLTNMDYPPDIGRRILSRLGELLSNKDAKAGRALFNVVEEGHPEEDVELEILATTVRNASHLVEVGLEKELWDRISVSSDLKYLEGEPSKYSVMVELIPVLRTTEVLFTLFTDDQVGDEDKNRIADRLIELAGQDQDVWLDLFESLRFGNQFLYLPCRETILPLNSDDRKEHHLKLVQWGRDISFLDYAVTRFQAKPGERWQILNMYDPEYGKKKITDGRRLQGVVDFFERVIALEDGLDDKERRTLEEKLELAKANLAELTQEIVDGYFPTLKEGKGNAE